MSDELILVIAQIFEVPEYIVTEYTEYFSMELGDLLQEANVQNKLKRHMKKTNWKATHHWWG